ncbi:MAG: pinensin family lanthipeptide [Cyclobacteriaceae bacterium]
MTLRKKKLSLREFAVESFVTEDIKGGLYMVSMDEIPSKFCESTVPSHNCPSAP